MTYVNPVVAWSPRKVLPKRIPLAEIYENVLILMTAVFPLAANQVLPAPSAPAGQRMLVIFEKPDSEVDGSASIWAFCSGIGTNEEENGVAPAEKGTLGLFVLLITVVPFPWKEVINDPAKKMLDSDVLVVMDNTSASAPAKPPNGGEDQDDDLGLQVATADPGLENFPPAHTLPSLLSQ
jgi:hypothetical protein